MSESDESGDSRELMRSIIQRIATGPELSKDISYEEARTGMKAVLRNEVDPVQAAVFLIALRMKRESDDETKGVLQAIREETQRVEAPIDELLDIADPYDGFNRHLLVSPFLPAVLASCGVATISHGVRMMGPKYGATQSQVLLAAGIAVNQSSQIIAKNLVDVDIGWGYIDQSLSCPSLYQLSSLRHQIVKRPVITTVEVLTGPIVARGKTHIMTGYVHKPYPRIYALLARHAGFSSALLVRGVEGSVTPSLKQKGKIWFYHDAGEETFLDLDPQALGIEQTVRAVPLPQDLPGYRKRNADAGEKVDAQAMAEAAAQAGLMALDGVTGPAFDALVYAGALALFHLNRAGSLADGARRIRQVLSSGQARSHFLAARQ